MRRSRNGGAVENHGLVHGRKSTIDRGRCEAALQVEEYDWNDAFDFERWLEAQLLVLLATLSVCFRPALMASLGVIGPNPARHPEPRSCT